MARAPGHGQSGRVRLIVNFDADPGFGNYLQTVVQDALDATWEAHFAQTTDDLVDRLRWSCQAAG